MTDHTRHKPIGLAVLRNYAQGHDGGLPLFVSLNGTRFAVVDVRAVFPIAGVPYAELVASPQAEYMRSIANDL